MPAYVFTHATVLDGTEGMEPQPNMTVVVNGGRIEAVGPAATTVPPAGAREIDLGGAYLMPGLVNAHVHLCGTGKPMSAGGAGDLIDKVTGNPIGMWYLRRMLRKNAQQQLASGVTTVRSVGDPAFADVDVRDAIDAGKYAGPRLVTSGTGVTVPGGHGAGLFAKVVSTPEEAREAVRACFARKCDLVKLFVTGGVFDAEVEGEPGVLRMSPEIARATCEEAHKLGMSTAAHIESTEGVRVGLRAGVDTIEHGGPLGRRDHRALQEERRRARLVAHLHRLACAAVRGAAAREDEVHARAAGERPHRVRGHRGCRPAGACGGHSRGPGNRLVVPLHHAVRHVARGGVLRAPGRRDACVRLAHGHARQRAHPRPR